MFELIDLSHSLNDRVPTWSGKVEFKKTLVSDYPNHRGMIYECGAGIATHIDAPAHFIKGGRTVDEFQPQELLCSLCIIDVRKKAHENYFITPEDIHEFEKKQGKIPPHSVVAALTGWSEKWMSPSEYRGADVQGNVHVPGFSKLTGPLLLERNIAGLGIDTLSPDGSDMTYPLHHLLLGSGKFLLENLTNLKLLPPLGAFILIAPLKIEEGAEAPARIFGLIWKR